MKIGDRKQHAIIRFTGNKKTDVLACFDQLSEKSEEQRLLRLEERKREVNEAAKRRF